MITKHTKPSLWLTQQGGIIHTEGPIDTSNVMYLLQMVSRQEFSIKIVDGKKVRVAKVKDQAAVVID